MGDVHVYPGFGTAAPATTWRRRAGCGAACTLQTAAIISRRLDLPLAAEFDLHEWLPDLTQTYDSSEVAAAAAEEMARCGGEWPEGESRGWEPLSSVRRRVLAVLRRYARNDGVIVVCHGTVIEALTGRSLGCGEQVRYELPPAEPASPPGRAPAGR